MGTWGTNIEDSDTYYDVKREFLDLYNQGVSVETLYSEFITEEDLTEISEESHDFYFAVADLLWQCKGLKEELFNVVKNIIESGVDLIYWQDTNGNEYDIKERKIELNKFLEKISVPKISAKKRIKKKLYESLFKKGDLITFRLKNNNYGVALVIDDDKGIKTESGKNLIVLSDFEATKKPTMNNIKEIKNAHVQYETRYRETYPFAVIADFSKMSWELFPTKRVKIEIITNLNIKTLNFTYNNMGLGWNLLPIWSEKNTSEIQIGNKLKFKNFIIKDNLVVKIKNWLQHSVKTIATIFVARR